MTQYTQQQTRTMSSDILTRVTVRSTSHTSINCSFSIRLQGIPDHRSRRSAVNISVSHVTHVKHKNHMYIYHKFWPFWPTPRQIKLNPPNTSQTTTFINKRQHKKAQKLKPSPNVTTNKVQFWLIYTKFNKRQSAEARSRSTDTSAHNSYHEQYNTDTHKTQNRKP